MSNVDKKPSNEPRLGAGRTYTRRGDAGETSLAGGQRVGKDSARIQCCGAVDELNAFVGMACFSAEELSERAPKLRELAGILRRVQHELSNLGSILATNPARARPKQPRLTRAAVEQLEREIDSVSEETPPLRSFLLPGGCRLSTELHVCRTICRRAERIAVALSREENAPAEAIQYLNRLSDAFFVWARWVNCLLGVPELLWEPNQTESAG